MARFPGRLQGAASHSNGREPCVRSLGDVSDRARGHTTPSTSLRPPDVAARLLGSVLVVVLTAGLLASCAAAGDIAGAADMEQTKAKATKKGTASAEPTPTESATPKVELAPAPKRGECRRLQVRDLNTVVNDRPTVSCDKRHTAVTYHIGLLPPDVVKKATSSGDDAVEAAADRSCTRAFGAYVGGSRSDRQLTSLRITYFLPPSDQFAAGADWVRCDVYVYASDARLLDLPRTVKGVLDDAEARSDLAICSTKGPDEPRFEHIVCSRTHRWRAVDTVTLGKAGTRYPGADTLGERAKASCEEQVRAYLDDTKEAFSFGFEVPRSQAWKRGERIGLCWSRTSD